MTKLPPLSFNDRALLYTQLAQLENAGLPAIQAYEVVRVDGPAAPRLAATRKWLSRGKNPADAGRAAGLFTPLEFTLVQAALTAGSPGRTYKRLGDYYTQRAAQAKAIRGRLMMPAFVLLVSLATGPLPSLVAGTISLGGYVIRVVGPLLILALLYGFVKSLPDLVRGTPWQVTLDALLPRLPVFGRLHVRSNARDFFESLGLMLEAGVPMFDALPLACATIQNPLIRAQYESILPDMRAGMSLSQALASVRYIGEGSVLAFAKTGESSGTLAEMLLKHAARETLAVNDLLEQLSIWLPRVAYGLVVVWVVYSLLTGPGIMPQVPADL